MTDRRRAPAWRAGTCLRTCIWIWMTALFAWAAPSLALAQEFEKVTGPLREEIPARPLVGAAYAFIWIALLVYVVLVAAGIGRVRRELAELRAKVDRATDHTGSGPGHRP
jgi:CcmD family protein